MTESDRDKTLQVMARRFRALGLSTAEAQRGANEALTALEASGRAVVPVEPTGKMVSVGMEARWRSATRNPDSVGDIWRAMIAASKDGKADRSMESAERSVANSKPVVKEDSE